MPHRRSAELPQSPVPLDIATCAVLACLWEATAAKPGNVHRGADFDNCTFAEFVTSAAVIAAPLAGAADVGVGQAVLSAVVAMRQAVAANTSLGTILLLAPLAAVPRDIPLESGIGAVLETLGPRDTQLVYEAIGRAGAGGLGSVAGGDIADAPPIVSLVEAMRPAAARDLVARQYVNSFHEVLHQSATRIAANLSEGWALEDSLVHAHVGLMAEFPDSLIARKCGPDAALQSKSLAAAVVAAGGPGDCTYRQRLAELDFWLRSDGRRRNPGTTADLVAAGLFVLLREQRIEWPVSFYGHCHG